MKSSSTSKKAESPKADIEIIELDVDDTKTEVKLEGEVGTVSQEVSALDNFVKELGTTCRPACEAFGLSVPKTQREALDIVAKVVSESLELRRTTSNYQTLKPSLVKRLRYARDILTQEIDHVMDVEQSPSQSEVTPAVQSAKASVRRSCRLRQESDDEPAAKRPRNGRLFVAILA